MFLVKIVVNISKPINNNNKFLEAFILLFQMERISGCISREKWV